MKLQDVFVMALPINIKERKYEGAEVSGNLIT